MTFRRKLIFAMVVFFLIGALVFGGAYFQQCCWDADFASVIQTTSRDDTPKQLERLLKTAKPDRQPYLRSMLVGHFMEHKDYARAAEEASIAAKQYAESGDLGGQINMLFGQAAIARSSNATASEKYLKQALQLLGDREEIPALSMPLFGFRIPEHSYGTPKSRMLVVLAGLKDESGQTDEAEKLFKLAMLTKDNLDHAQASESYADFLKEHHRGKDAEAVLKSAEDAIEAGNKGEEKFGAALADETLAYSAEAAGDFENALRLYKKSSKLTAEHDGLYSSDHVRCLAAEGHCLEKMGRQEEAGVLYEKTYAAAKDHDSTKKESDSSHIATTKWSLIYAGKALADYYAKEKQYARAELLYREAVKESAVGKTSMPVSMQYYDWTRIDLADCLLKEGKTDQAGELFKTSIAALEADKGQHVSLSFKAYDGYARILQAQHKDKEAKPFAERAKQFAAMLKALDAKPPKEADGNAPKEAANKKEKKP